MTDMEYTLDERVIRKPTHDTPEAALAAALRADWPCICTPIWTERGLSDPDCPHHDPEADAADLIAALDDWALVPRVATADWTGSTKRDVKGETP